MVAVDMVVTDTMDDVVQGAPQCYLTTNASWLL